MNKAVFLDRDGTLVEDPGFVYKVEDFKLLDNVVEGLELLNDKYKFFIVTNQAGVALGKFSLNDLQKFNDHLINELNKGGINIEKIYFCPHKPEDNCECRKPKTKFLLDAEKEFEIDLENSFVIGDKETDITLGRNGGCKSILVLTGYGEKYKDVDCDFVAKDLLDAAQWITNNS